MWAPFYVLLCFILFAISKKRWDLGIAMRAAGVKEKENSQYKITTQEEISVLKITESVGGDTTAHRQ